MLGSQAVRRLLRREQDGERSAFLASNGMNFGVAAAPVRADRLVVRPPLPPIAERCAFT